MLLPHRNLMLADSPVDCSPWRYKGSDVGDFLSWQPGLDIELSSEMEINLDDAAEVLRFDPRSEAEVVIEWRSDSTRLREHCGRFDLASSIPMKVTLPGDRIGGTVEIQRRIVTRSPVAGDDPFAPATSGAILWEDHSRVRIEGIGNQFAIVSSSFDGYADVRAPWAVRTPTPGDLNDPDTLAEPASEHVMVRLNANHAFAQRMTDPGEGDELVAFAFSVIASDIANGVVTAVLASDFGDEEEYEEGTLGAFVVTVLKKLGATSRAELAKYDSEALSALVKGSFMTWSGK